MSFICDGEIYPYDIDEKELKAPPHLDVNETQKPNYDCQYDRQKETIEKLTKEISNLNKEITKLKNDQVTQFNATVACLNMAMAQQQNAYIMAAYPSCSSYTNPCATTLCSMQGGYGNQLLSTICAGPYYPPYLYNPYLQCQSKI